MVLLAGPAAARDGRERTEDEHQGAAGRTTAVRAAAHVVLRGEGSAGSAGSAGAGAVAATGSVSAVCKTWQIAGSQLNRS